VPAAGVPAELRLQAEPPEEGGADGAGAPAPLGFQVSVEGVDAAAAAGAGVATGGAAAEGPLLHRSTESLSWTGQHNRLATSRSRILRVSFAELHHMATPDRRAS
jgi:hypothetical protein